MKNTDDCFQFTFLPILFLFSLYFIFFNRDNATLNVCHIIFSETEKTTKKKHFALYKAYTLLNWVGFNKKLFH